MKVESRSNTGAAFFVIKNKTKMRLLPVYLIFFTLCAWSQPHSYELQPAVPHNYLYNSDSLYRTLLGKNDPELTDKIQKDYAASLAFYHERMLDAGCIYFNWNEIEDYINGLVKKITQTVHTDKEFKVFLMRNEDVNASAQDNGVIYIYIGLLAEINDEAALVSVLAHEISHALNSDSKKMFIAQGKNKRFKVKNALSMSHENRRFEARADSLGFAVATALNYDLSTCYQTYVKFESDYRWYKSQYEYDDPKWYIALDNTNGKDHIKPDSLEKYLMDHPENSQRLAALNEAIKKGNGQNKFSGNEVFFNSIKYKARMEQLYIDFEEASYDNCLRNAFYYHLQNQDDKNYLYYTTECLRRILLTNPGLKRQGFMTEDSKEKVFEKNKGILNDITFISLDTIFCRKVKNDPVFGASEKPFETYLQAYNFFYKKALEKNIPGISLTAGLFDLNRNKKDKAVEELKKSLTEDQHHIDFISSILAGNQLADLQNNTTDYVYIETPDYFIYENGGLNYNYLESTAISEKLESIFKNFRTSKNSTVSFLIADRLNIVDYNLYSNLALHLKFFKPEKEANFFQVGGKPNQNEDYWKAMEANDPMNVDVLKRNKNFFNLNPDYWTLFRDKKIHSFTRINPYFYKHKILGTFFYFEIEYYDPITRSYFYFDQEYAERFNDANLNKVFKRFYDKLNN